MRIRNVVFTIILLLATITFAINVDNNVTNETLIHNIKNASNITEDISDSIIKAPSIIEIQSGQSMQSIRKTFNTNNGFYQEQMFDDEILNTVLSQSRIYYFNASNSYDTDGYITTYFWDFDDNTNSTQIFEKHKFQDRGIYFVTLSVTDNKESSRTAEVTINIMNATIPFRKPPKLHIE